MATMEMEGTLAVLDKSGDSRMQWNPNSPEEVAKARARFDEFRNKGYLAYKVSPSGGQGEVISAFDEAAARIILHSPMVGG
jgi:hypothetical protein